MATRSVCISLVALAMLPGWNPAPPPDDWGRYRARFVAAEGRVVDTGNGGVSHSEGQGFGLLLAEAHGDRETFDRLWAWTKANLRTRGDRLFAWKWVPGQGVTDANNATDGDLLIAWALLRGSTRWKAPELRDEALAIGETLLSRLQRTRGGWSYLLPGAAGFEHADGDVVNPSYMIFPAYDALGAATKRPEWKRLADSGLALTERARFGRHALPPDWLKLGDRLEPAPGWPARFGFDAVRVPLYLMAGERPAKALAPYQAYWRAVGRPAWVSLDDGAVAPFSASPGVKAIAEAALAYPQRPAAAPPLDDTSDYYSASLLLLSRAWLETRGRP